MLYFIWLKIMVYSPSTLHPRLLTELGYHHIPDMLSRAVSAIQLEEAFRVPSQDELKSEVCACLSVCLHVCLSVCLPVCLSVCLPVCLSVCLSINHFSIWFLSMFLSFCGLNILLMTGCDCVSSISVQWPIQERITPTEAHSPVKIIELLLKIEHLVRA